MRFETRLGVALMTLSVLVPAGGCETPQPNKISLQGGLQPVRMELDIDRRMFANAWHFKVQMDQNHKHLAYRETLTVGGKDLLVVHPGTGEKPVTLSGRPLKAEYFHVSRLLVLNQAQKNTLGRN